MKIEIENAVTVIEKPINDNGVIVGLKKWAGKNAKIVIIKEGRQ